MADDQTILEDGHFLRIRSGHNVRELGGYEAPGGRTRYHRFLRSGGTRSLTDGDLALLRDWGVARVVDLRSFGESPHMTCRFAKQNWVAWENVSLYDYDLSAPSMKPVRNMGGYFVSGYLNMLSSHKAMRDLFGFFAQARPHECILFHCAAGMDRTGVVAMLLLGLANVGRRQIVADYGYSFAPPAEVDPLLDAYGNVSEEESLSFHLSARLGIISTVYDTIIHEHGSVRAYLESCGITTGELDAVASHLLD